MTAADKRLDVRCTRLAELGADVQAEWSRLMDATGQRSPLLSPEFAGCADGAFGQVEVITVRKAGELVMVLPFHRRGNRFARPIGGVFSDVHGPVTAQGVEIDMPDVLRRANVSAYRFWGVEEPCPALAPATVSFETAMSIVLDTDPVSYIEARRAENPKRLKNFRRLYSKLVKERGTPEINACSTDRSHLDALIGWKSEQYRRGGLLDILSIQENLDFLQSIWDLDRNGVKGLLVTLNLDGQPIAAEFGVRRGDWFHPWLAGYHPEFSEYSPGSLLQKKIVQHMEAVGLVRIELGTGHDHYKKYFSSLQTRHAAGIVFGGGAAAMRERIGEGVWRGLEGFPQAKVGNAFRRLRRRSEQILTAESRMGRRAAAFADAFLKRSLRDPVREDDPHGG